MPAAPQPVPDGVLTACAEQHQARVYFVLISVPHLLQNLFEEYMLWIVTCFANVTPESVVRGAGGTHDRFYQVRPRCYPPCTLTRSPELLPCFALAWSRLLPLHCCSLKQSALA